jgi:hypothetical protein
VKGFLTRVGSWSGKRKVYVDAAEIPALIPIESNDVRL